MQQVGGRTLKENVANAAGNGELSTNAAGGLLFFGWHCRRPSNAHRLIVLFRRCSIKAATRTNATD